MRLGSSHGSASPASWHLKVGRRTFFPGQRASGTRCALRYSSIIETATTCCSSHQQCAVSGNDCVEILSGCQGCTTARCLSRWRCCSAGRPYRPRCPQITQVRAPTALHALWPSCLVPACQHTVSEDAFSRKDTCVLVELIVSCAHTCAEAACSACCCCCCRACDAVLGPRPFDAPSIHHCHAAAGRHAGGAGAGRSRGPREVCVRPVSTRLTSVEGRGDFGGVLPQRHKPTAACGTLHACARRPCSVSCWTAAYCQPLLALEVCVLQALQAGRIVLRLVVCMVCSSRKVAVVCAD